MVVVCGMGGTRMTMGSFISFSDAGLGFDYGLELPDFALLLDGLVDRGVPLVSQAGDIIVGDFELGFLIGDHPVLDRLSGHGGADLGLGFSHPLTELVERVLHPLDFLAERAAETILKEDILNRSGSGRTYGGHQASAPGEPPAPDVGNLKANTNADPSLRRVGAEIVGQITADAGYAEALEKGTEKMAARPFFGLLVTCNTLKCFQPNVVASIIVTPRQKDALMRATKDTPQ